MATGWYGRSVAAASLTRLPRGICCGVCGLTEPTPDSGDDGPADTAAAWATMTRHVLETHCTPCCVARRRAASSSCGPGRWRPGSAGRGRPRPCTPCGRAAGTQQRDRDRLRAGAGGARAAARARRRRDAAASRSAASPRARRRRRASATSPFAGMSPLAAARARAGGGGGRARARPRDRLRAQYAAERDVVDLTAPHPAELAGLAVLERGPPPRRARRDAAVYYDLTAQRPASAVPPRAGRCAHCACGAAPGRRRRAR